MYIMVDMGDTAFSSGRALIVCLFLQESFKEKEVVCMKSAMQILRFYLVGQKLKIVLIHHTSEQETVLRFESSQVCNLFVLRNCFKFTNRSH